MKYVGVGRWKIFYCLFLFIKIFGPFWILQVVLIENDINSRPFSSQVMACLPPLPWSVSSVDVANPIRQDLRHLNVFSVDPPGSWTFFYSIAPAFSIFYLLFFLDGVVMSVLSNNIGVNGLFVCSGCKDIDDALHCTALPNGNFEVGVRILNLLAFCLP